MVVSISYPLDAQDRVYCFNRNQEHPVLVFDRDGKFLSSWGAGLFAFPHVIRATRDGNLWIVDRDHAQMMLFDLSGRLLRTLGTKGFRSDTGVAPDYFKSDAYKSVTHGGRARGDCQDPHASGLACARAATLTGAAAVSVPGGLIRRPKTVPQRKPMIRFAAALHPPGQRASTRAAVGR